MKIRIAFEMGPDDKQLGHFPVILLIYFRFCYMMLHVHPENPQPRQLKTIVDCLQNGGVIIYPTDTLYGFGCDIFQHRAIEKICRIKKLDPHKARLSFICYDLGHLSDFSKQLPRPIFR